MNFRENRMPNQEGTNKRHAPITLNKRDTGGRQQKRKEKLRNTQQRKSKRSATWVSHKRGLTQVLVKGKKVLPFIRHPPCDAYSKDVLETTMHKQTNITKKTWALLHTTGFKDNPNIISDAEIVADIITRKSERKDKWQDTMLDITLRKQTQTTQ